MPKAKASEKKDEQPDRGLQCPDCGCGHWFVIKTRQASKKRLKRRRECRYCGRRITTYEQLAD